MARTNNLTNFLNDVATAIKTKLGDSTAIPAAQFDSKIMDIHTGGTYQTKSISITTNGNYTLLPDSGYDAMNQVSISVTVPSNAPIKMYNTREEMLLDTTEPEHEYGVVYGDKTERLTENTTTEFITFVDNVVLSSAITSSKFWYIGSSMKGIQLDFSLSKTSAYFRARKGSGTIAEIRYTSEDGITYVKASGDKYVDLGELVLFEAGSRGWMPEMEEFILNGGKFFEGMYEWVNETDEEYWNVITALNISGNNITCTNEEKYLPTLLSLLNEINSLHDDFRWFTLVKENGHYVYYVINQNNATSICGVTDSNNPFNNFAVCLCHTNPYGFKFVLDLENDTYTEEQIQLQDIGVYSGTTRQYGHLINITELVAIGFGTTLRFDFKMANLTNPSSPSTYTDKLVFGHVSFLTWHHVKTEFTLEHPHQLLPGVNALGKHGDVVGDGSIYQHINLNQLLPEYVYYNSKFLMSSSVNIDKQNYEVVNYFNNISLYNTTPTISEKLYLADLSGETYNVILARYYKPYILLLCDDNKIRIYNEQREFITDISINNVFDYTNSNLMLVPKVIDNKICFAICVLSTSSGTTSALCMGYYDLVNETSQCYYNNSVTAYYPYYKSYANCCKVIGIRYVNNHLYVVLPNYKVNGYVYEDGVLKCTLPVNTNQSTGYIYYPVMAPNGIYYYEDNRLYGLKSYVYYIYGNTTSTTYNLPQTDQYTGKCIGMDQYENVYLQMYRYSTSSNNCYKFYSLSNGNTLNLLFDYGTTQVESERETMDIIKQGDVYMCVLSYNIHIIDTLNNTLTNTHNIASMPNTDDYRDNIIRNDNYERYSPIITDNKVRIVKTRGDIKLLNDKQNLLDITPANVVNKKEYMVLSLPE